MHVTVRALVCLGLLAPLPCAAQWTPDTTVNTPVAVAGTTQTTPVAATDNLGGLFVAFWDSRDSLTTGRDIRVQHINAHGFRDWGTSGVPVVQISPDQTAPGVLAAADGGVYVASCDLSSPWRVRIQRFSVGGGPLWGTYGVEPATTGGVNPRILAGPGGDVFVAWQTTTGSESILAQRLDPNGNPLWGSSGVTVCTATGAQIPRPVDDGAGGMLVAWSDSRTGVANGYAQRVNGSGILQWATAGIAIAPLAFAEGQPAAMSDGAGGMILAWTDARDGTSHVYVQRINASGTLLWGATGLRVSTTNSIQAAQNLRVDAAGNAYLVWEDQRSGNRDVYAQKIDPTGARLWGAGGLGVCTLTGDQAPGLATIDGTGGLYSIWTEVRLAGRDVYAQHVLPAGTLAWPAAGKALSTATGDQSGANFAPDSQGGAIAFWTDRRSDGGDIYAQHVLADGSLGPTVGVGPSRAPGAFALAVVGRVPVTTAAALRLDLPEAGAIEVAVLDLQGRRLRTLASGTFAAGSHPLSWDLTDAGGARAPAGVYFAVARAGSRAITTRLIALR